MKTKALPQALLIFCAFAAMPARAELAPAAKKSLAEAFAFFSKGDYPKALQKVKQIEEMLRSRQVVSGSANP